MDIIRLKLKNANIVGVKMIDIPYCSDKLAKK